MRVSVKVVYDNQTVPTIVYENVTSINDLKDELMKLEGDHVVGIYLFKSEES